MNRVQGDSLDLDALLAETLDTGCGALVVFAGTVRDQNDGRAVDSINYTAHAALAEKAFARIEAEARERFQVGQCRILHRTGALVPGEISVLVVVRAAHREAAFAAAKYAIDTLKVTAPVWKEEHYADGDSRFLEGTTLQVRKT